MHTQIIMDHHCEEKASKLEKEKADQQLSGIAQISSNINTTVKDQQTSWITKIQEDFDVIDYFFSNAYKYSATPMLRAEFFKDAEAYKEDSSQCYSIKDSSEDNLLRNSSVRSRVLCSLDEENLFTFDSDYLGNSHDIVIDTSLTYDDFVYDFDPYHDDIIMYNASQLSHEAAPRGLILNVTNNTGGECDSWITFDFDYLENLRTNVIERPLHYEMGAVFDPYFDDMIFTLHHDLERLLQQG